MPMELKPMSKRKATAKPVKPKRAKIVPKEVVEKKFQILEQKEREQRDDDETSVKAVNESDDEGDAVSLSNLLCT